MIEPYFKYPNLLEILFSFLKTEQTAGIRREVIRVLGLLGALDPYKRKQHQRSSKRSKMGTPISKPMDKKTQGPGAEGGRGERRGEEGRRERGREGRRKRREREEEGVGGGESGMGK